MIDQIRSDIECLLLGKTDDEKIAEIVLSTTWTLSKGNRFIIRKQFVCL